MNYEIVVGLEVHCQLNTKTKAYCACPTIFGSSPNQNVCPVCLALPGALPVLNKKALENAIKIGLATNCQIAKRSYAARKNYFYPDLPKGYQISQSDMPICSHGFLELSFKEIIKKVRINRIHIEEDAGKSIHDIGVDTYIDINRSGLPLLEIVSEPDIQTPEEASIYLEKLRQLVRYLNISDGDMEKGSLRCDANVSIREKGSKKLGIRTEVKNMNSFKSVESAIAYEADRQHAVLESGKAIVQETRLWDADKQVTRSMRSKEDSHDYRYFPEPDLLPFIVTDDLLRECKESLPELPEKRARRLVTDYSIPLYDASVITSDKQLADYYEDVVSFSKDPKASSNWLMGEVLRVLKEKKIQILDFKIQSQRLGKLIMLINKNVISNTIAKQVFDIMLDDNLDPEDIVKEKQMSQLSDEGKLNEIIDEVLEKNGSQLKEYKSGKTKLFGFFVGKVMKMTKGKANPVVVNALIKKKIDT